MLVVSISCNERSTCWPRPVSRAECNPASPQMHVIAEATLRFWRPQALTACSGVPEMLRTPLSAAGDQIARLPVGSGAGAPERRERDLHERRVRLDELRMVDPELGQATVAASVSMTRSACSARLR